MKKKLLFLITAIVLLSLTFSGCGNDPPVRMYRWDAKGEGQTLIYDITLINQNNSIAPSSITSAGYGQTEYRLGLYHALQSKDEKEPLAISGTYTVNIKESEENPLINVYTETLTADIVYNITDLDGDFLQELEKSSLTFVKTETTVTISISVNSLTAFYPGTLKPVESERIVQSFYIGKSAQAINDYKISCGYVTEGNNYFCEYTFVDNINASNSQEGRFKFSNSDSAPAYDNNLFFLAPRLYESSQVVSGVSYNIIEPLQKKGVVTFSFGGYSGNTLEVGGKTVYNASVYMATQNGSQFTIAVDAQQKRIMGASDSRNTYIPLLIQQDWLLFTLQEEFIPAEALIEPSE